jgi:hypothetical protein
LSGAVDISKHAKKSKLLLLLPPSGTGAMRWLTEDALAVVPDVFGCLLATAATSVAGGAAAVAVMLWAAAFAGPVCFATGMEAGLAAAASCRLAAMSAISCWLMLLATGSLLRLLLRGLPLLLLLCLGGMPLLLARARLVVLGLLALAAPAAAVGAATVTAEAAAMIFAAGCCLLGVVSDALATAEAARVVTDSWVMWVVVLWLTPFSPLLLLLISAECRSLVLLQATLLQELSSAAVAAASPSVAACCCCLLDVCFSHACCGSPSSSCSAAAAAASRCCSCV